MRRYAKRKQIVDWKPYHAGSVAVQSGLQIVVTFVLKLLISYGKEALKRLRQNLRAITAPAVASSHASVLPQAGRRKVSAVRTSKVERAASVDRVPPCAAS